MSDQPEIFVPIERTLEAHFVVSTVAGVMLTACEKAISPKAAQGASVGKKQFALVCSDCERIVTNGWITLADGA